LDFYYRLLDLEQRIKFEQIFEELASQTSDRILYCARTCIEHGTVDLYVRSPCARLLKLPSSVEVLRSCCVERPELAINQNYEFYLKGNTAKRSEGKMKPIFYYDEKMDWLQRKATQSGFKIESAKIFEYRGQKKHDVTHQNRTFAISEFEGVLKITDMEAFKQAYYSGIGKGRTSGLGMLLLPQIYKDLL
jgi:CRISPR-associated protein Cas6/Cse3/CasE subtype I-E